MNLPGLLKHRKIVYSQYGEEGILEYILKKLEIDYIQTCEFGMSGTTFSNTLYFIENFNSYGVFIDQSSDNLKDLSFNNTHTIVRKIEINGVNSIDTLLKETKLSSNFDILSIDIDNEDYLVWERIKEYVPKIVVIEFNPFLPLTQEYIYDGSKFSSSFLSTVKLGESKGYKLVCMTGNLIFVRKDILEGSSLGYLLHLRNQDLFLDDAIVDPRNARSYTFKRYTSEIPKTSLI